MNMTVVDEIADILRSLRGVWDEDEVDELDHALQAGHHALLDGADDELLLATVLHDIGHSPLLLATDRHDRDAQNWLTPRLGERVGWLAGSHVAAKKWRAAHDSTYLATLSPTSIASLADQGGADGVGPEWTTHPWWPDALALRGYDDAAKVRGAVGIDVDVVIAAAGRVCAGRGGR